MKNIGKPCAGKPYARFDEGGLVKAPMDWLLRHRQTKGAETDRSISNGDWSLLSTLPGALAIFGGGLNRSFNPVRGVSSPQKVLDRYLQPLDHKIVDILKAVYN
jgi:hypothetical protein